MAASADPHIPILSGLGDGAVPARAWLCDVWGVLHNGVVAFPGAVDALCRFRESGGHVILLTNAPRPADAVVQQLDRLSVPRRAYDAVLTSGDVTREVLKGWRGVETLHIGPERDLSLFDGLGIPLVAADRARRILCSGLFDDTTETPDNYRATLDQLAQRAVPMFTANPDITVDRGGTLIYCAGALAQLYATLGGSVDYAGKPYPRVYEIARRRLGELAGAPIADADILAIGDGIRTDIAGGLAAGLRTLYVASPVDLGEAFGPTSLAKLFADPAKRPLAAIEKLVW